jgi:hypothetical protein
MKKHEPRRWPHAQSIAGPQEQLANAPNSECKVSHKSIEALEAVHERKRQRTLAKINAALIRMANGTPAVLKSDFKWTQAALAAEAGIHPNTLGSKNDDGVLVYSREIDRLNHYAHSRKRTAVDLRQKQIEAYKAELVLLATHQKDLLKQLEAKELQVIRAKEETLAAIADKEAMIQRLNKAGLST